MRETKKAEKRERRSKERESEKERKREKMEKDESEEKRDINKRYQNIVINYLYTNNAPGRVIPVFL